MFWFFFTVSPGSNKPSFDYNPESDKLGLVTIDDVRERGKRHIFLYVLSCLVRYLTISFFLFFQTNYLSGIYIIRIGLFKKVEILQVLNNSGWIKEKYKAQAPCKATFLVYFLYRLRWFSPNFVLPLLQIQTLDNLKKKFVLL